VNSLILRLGYPIQRFGQNSDTTLRYILKRRRFSKIAFVTCVREEMVMAAWQAAGGGPGPVPPRLVQ